MLCSFVERIFIRRKSAMKQIISTIVAVAIISTLSVTPATAGGRGAGVDPIWIPVAIFSTLAAVAIAQPTVVHEQRISYERPRVVVYEEPRHHRHHERHYDRDRWERRYEVAQYREYR
jgi:hypothetical protein